MKINWYGAFGSGQGYSGASENIVKELEKQGVDVRIMGIKSGNDTVLSKEFLEIRKKEFELADIGIFFGFPAGFDSMINKYKIGFTMFETTKLPNGNKKKNNWAGADGDAVKIINETLDELWVPCEHNRQLFLSEGVTVPIKVVNLGVDSNVYKPLERNHKGKPFTFLSLGTLTIRKNPGMILSAFMSLFKDNPEARLVLKTQSGTLAHIETPYKNIEIIDKLSTPKEVMKYYEEADCFVFPSRGEGFGLPPVEAMATGLPAIFSDNTGLSEFADSEYNYPIAIKEETPAIRFPKDWGDVGNWYEPDYDDFKAKMLYVFEHQDEAKIKGSKASEWVGQHFTYEQTAKRIGELLRKAEDKLKVN